MATQVYMRALKGLGLLVPILLASALADDCIIPETYPHFISGEMHTVDSSTCYTCYHSPSGQEFNVNVNEMRLQNVVSVMIYVNSKQKHLMEDCGGCDVMDGSGDGESQCQECDISLTGTMFEMYVRLSSPEQDIAEGESVCQSLPNLNISLTIVEKEVSNGPSPDCSYGSMVSWPLSGDTCTINTTALDGKADTKLDNGAICLVPTCSKGIISPDITHEKIEHKFHPSSKTETCIWQLNTEQRKHITLRFSHNVRPHLLVYEDSLHNPKWDVEWCPVFGNEFELQTEADVVYIVYHSLKKLTKKGSLSITTRADLCLLPPRLKNGSVEFKRLESGTVARYMCDMGYSLHGPSEIRCRNKVWEEPPICLELDKPEVLIPEEEIKAMEDVTDKEEEVELEIMTEFPTLLEEEFVGINHTEVELDFDGFPDMFPDNSTSVDEEVEEEKGLLSGLFEFNLTDKEMMLYIIIGAAGLLILTVITIISVVIYRKRYPVRLGLGRKFDTFQNPIYEKTVVRMPMQVEETEVGGKKSDTEELSDCTVLE